MPCLRRLRGTRYGAAMQIDHIRTVLVETSHPGNIGAAARAMKNMCLSRLALVRPQQFPHSEASARASGADDVLAAATVHDSLAQAVSDCHVVIGASARMRKLRWPQLDPRECAALVAQASLRGPVALVFGRERSGLSNEELERCHYLVHIPCNPDYSSLNVAAAVQVVAYEIMMAASGAEAPLQHREPESDPETALDHPADSGELERFYRHLEQVLVAVEFLDPAQPKHLMRRLKRLYNRAHPDLREINILRGMLSAIQRRLGEP